MSCQLSALPQPQQLDRMKMTCITLGLEAYFQHVLQNQKNNKKYNTYPTTPLPQVQSLKAMWQNLCAGALFEYLKHSLNQTVIGHLILNEYGYYFCKNITLVRVLDDGISVGYDFILMDKYNLVSVHICMHMSPLQTAGVSCISKVFKREWIPGDKRDPRSLFVPVHNSDALLGTPQQQEIVWSTKCALFGSRQGLQGDLVHSGTTMSVQQSREKAIFPQLVSLNPFFRARRLIPSSGSLWLSENKLLNYKGNI